DALIAELQDALVETWDALGIPYAGSGRPAVAKTDRIIPLLVNKAGG
ncbi:MAG: 5-aminolevulinate synthase, partial [Mesorhizobium sp.]